MLPSPARLPTIAVPNKKMNISKYFLAIAALFTWSALFAQESDPVLMRVAGTAVTRSEFEYAFNKNNTGQDGAAYSVEEYLPMFVNFKLKVAEAKAQKLDTLTSFKKEYEKDRAAFAEEYLTDKDFVELEAYRIFSKDSSTIGKDGILKVMHLAIPVSQKATPQEVAAAKEKYTDLTLEKLRERYRQLHQAHKESDSSEIRAKLRVELAAICEVAEERQRSA